MRSLNNQERCCIQTFFESYVGARQQLFIHYKIIKLKISNLLILIIVYVYK